MTNVKSYCYMCKKETSIFTCGGCSKNFCQDDLIKHRQILDQKLGEIENYHDKFREIIVEQRNGAIKHPLIQQVDKWEEDSIKKIKQTAEECRERLIKYTNKSVIEIENQLNDLTEQLEEIRQDNTFNEIHLNQFKEKLIKLEGELHKPANISIDQQFNSFIHKISTILPFEKDTKWKQVGVTVAGGHGQGNKLNQLYQPLSIFIDDNRTIYIADTWNHRIVQWQSNATTGQILAGGNGKGDQINKLSEPTDVLVDQKNDSLIIADGANRRVMQWSCQRNTTGQIIISNIDCFGLTMDKEEFLYVSDWQKNEVKRWKRGEKDGVIVAGGLGKGSQLNQLNYPTLIFVDEDYSLYISDGGNHRVIKWEKDAKEGIVVAGGNGQGKSLTQLCHPRGVIVDRLGQVYVADYGNDRVMRWCKGDKEGTIIVDGNGKGEQSNQLKNPKGLSFDRDGHLYVVDSSNHRIQKFEIN